MSQPADFPPAVTILIFHIVADYFEISVWGYTVNTCIEECENKERGDSDDYKKRQIVQVEKLQAFPNKGKCESKVESCHNKRCEENRKHLWINAFFDFLFRHANFLHYFKPCAILIALRHLFVVDDEHGREDEYDAEHDSDEEQSAV